ncbi:MAG TPA: hypothetical protein VGC91_20540 [Pyrinomonadaceae bacterium]
MREHGVTAHHVHRACVSWRQMRAVPLICRLLTQALSLTSLCPHADAWDYTLSPARAG